MLFSKVPMEVIGCAQQATAQVAKMPLIEQPTSKTIPLAQDRDGLYRALGLQGLPGWTWLDGLVDPVLLVSNLRYLRNLKNLKMLSFVYAR